MAIPNQSLKVFFNGYTKSIKIQSMANQMAIQWLYKINRNTVNGYSKSNN